MRASSDSVDFLFCIDRLKAKCSVTFDLEEGIVYIYDSSPEQKALILMLPKAIKVIQESFKLTGSWRWRIHNINGYLLEYTPETKGLKPCEQLVF